MDVHMFSEEDLAETHVYPTSTNLDTDGLPFPRLVDGQIFTQYIRIDGLKRPQLQSLCREFKLLVSGNMSLLRERLEEFSRNPDKWESLQGHARRAHLGPHSGKVPRASTTKKSTQRRNEMFETPTTRSFPKISSTVVPEQRWNQAQHTADMNWAVRIMHLYPYRVEEARMRLAAQEAGQLSRDRSRDSSAERERSELKQELETANTNISKLLDVFHPSSNHTPPVATALATLKHTSDTTHPTETLNHSQHHLQLGKFATTSISSPPSSERLLSRSITLAHGQILKFDMNDVPAPPAVSFAKNLPALNRMWDDSSSNWDGHSDLVIRGVPIPIIYWRAVYTSKPNTNWLPKQWESLKGKWFDWKILVERWRKGTPESFWKEFSEDGKHLGYKMILRRLAEQRATQEHAFVAKIKAEYGDEFSSLFSYVKKGRTHVKVKPCHIIKQYCKLKGLANNDDNEESDASESE